MKEFNRAWLTRVFFRRDWSERLYWEREALRLRAALRDANKGIERLRRKIAKLQPQPIDNGNSDKA